MTIFNNLNVNPKLLKKKTSNNMNIDKLTNLAYREIAINNVSYNSNIGTCIVKIGVSTKK